MTNYISRLHSDLRQTRVSGRGANPAAPERGNAVQGLCKTYQRMEKVPLPVPKKLDQGLSDIITLRESFCHGSEEGNISLNDWGTLLGTSLSEKSGTYHRQYPSGGSLCPVETYVIAVVPGRKLSAMHYNPKKHEFEYLWPTLPQFEISATAVLDDGMLFSSMIVFTGVWKRASVKYGDLAYNLALLEAGHMGQNILLTATAMGLQSRAVVGFRDEILTNLFNLDTEDEQVIYAIAISQ